MRTEESAQYKQKPFVPSDHLTKLEQAENEFYVTNQVQTPFDYSQLIQTINNPCKLDEVISVRTVQENVSPYAMCDAETEANEEYVFKCKQCQGKLNQVENDKRHPKLRIQCCNCQHEIKVGSVYLTCDTCKQDEFDDQDNDPQQTAVKNDYYFCARCAAKELSQHEERQKSSMHKYFEDQVFPQDSLVPESREQLPQEFEDNEVKAIEYGTAVASKTNNWRKSKTYAKICYWKREQRQTREFVKEPSHHEMMSSFNAQSRRSSHQFPENKSVSQLQSYEHVICYRETKVANPLCQKKAIDQVQLSDFVFQSDCQTRIFYFSEPQTGEVTMTIVNLKGDMESRQHRVTDKRIKTAILNFFSHDENKRHQQVPLLMAEGQILCIQSTTEKVEEADQQYQADQYQNQPFQRTFVKGPSFNKKDQQYTQHLNFINVRSWDLEFQIEDVQCLLQQTDPLSAKTSLMFVRSNKLVKVMWPTERGGKPRKVFETQMIRFPRKLALLDLHGYVHCGQNRVTIIIKNYNWYCYDISNPSKNFPQIFQPHDAMRDAVFLRDSSKPDCLQLAGHLTSMIRDTQIYDMGRKQLEDFFQMNVINLNDDFERDVKNSIWQQRKKIIFRLQQEFADLQIPMRVGPLSLIRDEVFNTQVIYKDLRTGFNNAIFLGAKLTIDEPRVQKSKIQHLHSWMMPTMQKIVNYPILAYTSYDPNQKELMICNLVKNIPQKKLMLDFKIMCFCDQSQKLHDQHPNMNVIYFLGMKMDYSIHLYRIQTDPWQSMDDELNLSQIKMDIDFGDFPTDQIKAAQIMMIVKDEELKYGILVQLPDEIICITDDQENGPEVLAKHEEDHNQIAPITLISGILERSYFVRRSKNEGDELMIVKYCEIMEKISSQGLYKQKEKILQIKIAHEKQPTMLDSKLVAQGGQFYVLDQSYHLRILEYENKRRQTQTAGLVVIQDLNMSDFPIMRVMRSLDAIPWSNCILTNRAIVCSQFILINKMTDNNETVRKQFTYSTTTKSFHESSEFHEACDQSKDVECLEVDQIKNIGKIMSIFKEDTYCFFRVCQHPILKRVDLMNYVQQHAHDAELYALKSLILVVFKEKSRYLVFSQRTQMLIQIGNDDLELIDNVHGNDRIILKNNQVYCIFDEDGNLNDLYSKDQIEKVQCTQFLTLINKGPSKLGLEAPPQFKDKFMQLHFRDSMPIIIRQLEKEDCKGRMSNRDNDVLQLNLVECHADSTEEPLYGQFDDLANRLFYFHVQGAKVHPDSIEFMLTDRHIVIIAVNMIWIIKRETIKEFRNRSEDFSVSQANESLSLNDFAIRKFQTISLDQMYEGVNTYETGIKIHQVCKQDLQIVCNAQQNDKGVWEAEKCDAIQLTFLELSVMWDLDSNSEIYTLQRPSEFCDMQNFTRTGFYYSLDRDYSQDDPAMLSAERSFLQQNQERTLISAPLTKSSFSMCFRQFSLNELKQIMFLDERAFESGSKQIQTNDINARLLTVNIYGETFFSTFYADVRMLDLAYRIMIDEGFDRDEDEAFDDIELRQIYYTICLPFIESEDKHDDDDPSSKKVAIRKNCFGQTIREEEMQKNNNSLLNINRHNLVQWMVKYDKPEVEKLLKILLLSSEVQIRTLIQHFEQFRQVFDIQHDLINQFMENSLAESPHCKRLTSMSWESNMKIVCFTANTSGYSTNSIKLRTREASTNKQQYIRKVKNSLFTSLYGAKTHRKLCQVRIVEIKWINNQIQFFYKFLANEMADKAAIFDNELIKILLQEQNYTFEIFSKIFLPYMLYMTLMLIYFLNYIPYEHEEHNGFFDEHNLPSSLIRIVAVLLSMILFFFEWQQIMFLKMEYWYDIWNYINITQLVINLYILVEHSTKFTQVNEPFLVKLTSFACILLALLFFYWMRLISSMAFYVKMIMETIADLKSFVVFYLLIVSTFATAQFILDQYKEKVFLDTEFDYLNTMKKQTSHPLTDAWINQYLLGLGDFYTIPLQFSDFKDLEWIYFIMATFFTQIVFLNMLIAIMGDTFNRITEKKSRNGLMQQTALYSDFMIFLKKNKYLDQDKFLYMVTPVQSSDLYENENEWEGGYNRIKEKLDGMENRQNENTRKRSKTEQNQLKFIESQLLNQQETQRRILQQIDKPTALTKEESNKTLISRLNHQHEGPQRSIMTNRLNLPPLLSLNDEQPKQVMSSRRPQNRQPLVVNSSHALSSADEDNQAHIMDQDNNRNVAFEVNQSNEQIQQLKTMILQLNNQLNSRLDNLQEQGFNQDVKIRGIQNQIHEVMQRRQTQIQQRQQQRSASPINDRVEENANE